MIKFKKYLLVSALATMFTTQAQAEFVLDSFDSYDSVLELTSSGAIVSDTKLITTTGVSVDFTVDADAAFITLDNSVFPNSVDQNGMLTYSASNTPGEVTLKYYDAIAGTGGFASSINNTADFTLLGDQFYFSLADAVDGPFNVELTVSYWDGSGYANDVASFTVADGQAGDIFLEFASFLNADFTQIQSSTVVITTSNPNADFDLDEVGLSFVPEPSALALLGVGLLGLSFRSRKKLL